MPDDIVVVRRQPEADPGDIVVAMVGDEATVKTLRRKGGRWVLLPENPDFPPIIPPPQSLVILGKVIEVRRYLEKLALIEANS
jgi:repressor LexA